MQNKGILLNLKLKTLNRIQRNYRGYLLLRTNDSSFSAEFRNDCGYLLFRTNDPSCSAEFRTPTPSDTASDVGIGPTIFSNELRYTCNYLNRACMYKRRYVTLS